MTVPSSQARNWSKIHRIINPQVWVLQRIKCWGEDGCWTHGQLVDGLCAQRMTMRERGPRAVRPATTLPFSLGLVLGYSLEVLGVSSRRG